MSIIHAELVCMGASPGVSVAPVPSKMQFAIWVPLTPIVRVVTPHQKRQVPLVIEAIWTTGPVVSRIVPPMLRVIVRLAGVAGVL